MNRSNKWSRLLGAALVAVAVLAGASSAQAHVLTITDLNTTVSIDPHSQSGMFNWDVDGVDQIFQQWFWFRIGDNPEASIDTLQLVSEGVLGRNAEVVYAGNGFTIDIAYLVTGGTNGSGASDVAETIRIINTGTTSLDFHFFQYSDFDLNGSSGGQTVQILGGNTARQGGNGILLTETVVTPAPSHFEAAEFPDTIAKLNDGSASDLNDNPLASGDVTWAFQWDRVIAAGGTFVISKDKNITRNVPEPFSLGIWGLGLALGAVAARRRRVK
jgi:hypothetical protein